MKGQPAVITCCEQSHQIESGAVQTNLPSELSAEQVCEFPLVLHLAQHNPANYHLYQSLCKMSEHKKLQALRILHHLENFLMAVPVHTPKPVVMKDQ